MHQRLISIIQKKMKNMIYKDLDTSTYVIVSMEGFNLQMTIFGIRWGVFMNRIYRLTVIAQTTDQYIPQH